MSLEGRGRGRGGEGRVGKGGKGREGVGRGGMTVIHYSNGTTIFK